MEEGLDKALELLHQLLLGSSGVLRDHRHQDAPQRDLPCGAGSGIEFLWWVCRCLRPCLLVSPFWMRWTEISSIRSALTKSSFEILYW